MGCFTVEVALQTEGGTPTGMGCCPDVGEFVLGGICEDEVGRHGFLWVRDMNSALGNKLVFES